MKRTEYKVIYLNGNEEVFYSFGVWAVWAAATHYAESKATDSRIKYIIDTRTEVTYSKFDLSYETYNK